MDSSIRLGWQALTPTARSLAYLRTHEQLCERAVRWLHGTVRCSPVFSRIASCSEIPDAIGWSSGLRGSVVVECKTSRSDFLADEKKYIYYSEPEYPDLHTSAYRVTKKMIQEKGLVAGRYLRMGDFRYFMSEPGIVTEEMVKDRASDHGLLHVFGRRVRVILEAPRRAKDTVNHEAEIRYLRFAIINCKSPYAPLAVDRNRNVQMELV